MATIADQTFDLDAEGLRDIISGDVYTPQDAEWDEARLAWNLAVDQRPALVVLAENAADIVAAVNFARRNGLRVAPQGTGHGASALSLADDVMLLKTERMRGVEIRLEQRIARAEAGVLWMEVTPLAHQHGLAALAGSSPDVGVVGYSLGGGIGWLARKHGIATNSIVAAELVTADGTLRRVDADNDPDLFWAIRGGGGNFGIVTALEFRLYPIAEVYAGALFYPFERTREVVQAWREWTATLPDEVTSTVRTMQFPPIPDIPEPLRGKAFAIVEATYAGDEREGSVLVEPMRALGPVTDTFGTIPAPALQHLHMDPEHPVPGAGDGMLLSQLTPRTVDAFVEAAGPGSGSPLLSVELRHLGGAVSRPAEDGGVLDRIDAPFAMFAVGIAATPEMRAAVEAHVGVVKSALAPWESSQTYYNFRERGVEGSSFYTPDAYARLRAVRDAADPGRLFLANHPVAS
jgi:FAD/FMN-containing dehydrogenase